MQTRKAAVTPVSPLAQYVDELGALEAEMAPHADKLKRIETLRTMIRRSFDDKPASQNYNVAGKEFFALVSPRGKTSVVDVAKLAKAIGVKALLAIATVTLKSAQASCPPEALGEVVVERQNGPRGLRILRRWQAPESAAKAA